MTKINKVLDYCKQNGWVSRSAADLKICDDKQCPSCFRTRQLFSKEAEELIKEGTEKKEPNESFKNMRTCQKKT